MSEAAETLLLAFTAESCVHDAETLSLSGEEDAQNRLDEAASLGFVRPHGLGWVLTDMGRRKRGELASELGLPPERSGNFCDPGRLEGLRIGLLLGRATQKWQALYEFKAPAELPLAALVTPGYSAKGGKYRVAWPSSLPWRRIAELCPRWDGQGKPPVASRWNRVGAPAGTMRLDALGLFYSDHRHYSDRPHARSDKLGMINAERIFAFADIRSAEDVYSRLGLLGQALATQRLVENPVYFDFDEDFYEPWNIALFVTSRDEGARDLARILQPQASRLAEGLSPIMVSLVSLETLRRYDRTFPSHYDLWGEGLIHVTDYDPPTN